MDYDVVIVGAGAAGLMCAREAGLRGRKVLVLERSERVGKKILISGGGRCNFTNLYSNPGNFLSENAHFCKSALARFKPSQFIALVEKHGIPYYEKKSGQLFCKSSAKEIVGLLLKECEEAGVEIRLRAQVQSVERKDRFCVVSRQGEFQSASLVIATGGLSFPNLGASDFGYRLAERFGLRVSKCSPALVPLVFHEEDQRRFFKLSGVSLDVRVTCNKKSFRENLLMTHRGLSGPAILQISSYWNEGDVLAIDLFPNLDILEFLMEKKLRKEKMELKNILAQFLPKRFAELWCGLYAPSRPLIRYSDKELREIASHLHHWEISPKQTEGYAKAEVTRGGVDTAEISSKTFEAKKVRGLYFIGEVVDVAGHLGGHNFQWAWASGFCAGQAV